MTRESLRAGHHTSCSCVRCVGFDSGEGHGASGGRWRGVGGSASACGGSGAAAGMARLAQGAVVHDREAAAGELGVARLGGDARVSEHHQDQRLGRIPQSPCRQIRTATSPFLLKLSSPRTIQVHCVPVVLLRSLCSLSATSSKLH